MKTLRWIGLVTTLFATSAMSASVQNKALDAELAAVVNDPAHQLASLSVLAVKNGKVVYQHQFGDKFIDLTDPAKSKPADHATMYRAASISKFITTLGVMKMVEQGRLDLDRDIGDYLGYAVRNPNFPDSPITLRMLMSHTSSLRDGGGYYWEAKLKVDLKDVLVPGGSRYGEGAMWAKEGKPGVYFQYCNFAWGVIGTVMEKVSGERFDRLMRKLILDPMQIPGGFNPADLSPAEIADIATLYRKRTEQGDKEIWNPGGPWVVQVDDYSKEPPAQRALPDYVPGTNGTLFGPQGNCRISAEGLSKVMLMLMNGGMLNGKRILKAKTVETMLAEQWRRDDSRDGGKSNGAGAAGSTHAHMNAWGLGNQHFLDIGGRDGKLSRADRLVEGGGFSAVGHLGDAWGLTSAIVFDRKTKTGMVFLIGGPSFDPETYLGEYGSLYRHEEKILTALYRHAIQGK